jgi:uncharacterized OB-fold protein
MKFEMTKCNRCGSEILLGLEVCPSCGKQQASARASFQPRTLLAVALAVAVLFAFNWMKPAPPHARPVNSPPSATLPSR